MRWAWTMAGLLGCAASEPGTPLPPACAGDCGGEGGQGGEGALVMCGGETLPAADSAVIDCADVTVSVELVGPAVAHLRYVPAGEPAPIRPSRAVLAAPPIEAVIGADDARLRVCGPEITVEVDRASCRVSVLDADGYPISEDPEDGGFARGGPLGSGARGLVRRAADGERFYGFGERTGRLDKRGQSLTFWNTDAYVSDWGGYPPGADPLYQSIPFFVGLRDGRAYGVLLDNTHRLELDMGEGDPARYALWAEGGALDAYVIGGPRVATVVERYAALTGTMARPPRWALGYHQSRWGYAPAAQVLDVAETLRARHLGADALWLDIQHLDGFRSFSWDAQAFPDPAGLVAALAGMGLKTVAIVDPAIKVDPGWDVYAEGLAAGHFLRDAGGEAYVGEVWPGAAVFPDFSAAATRDWWGTLVPRTLDAGVRGLWIDMNEPSDFAGPGGTVPNEIVADGDGAETTMAEMHNVYALDEARATYAGMRAARPDRRPFVLTRAGYAGIQRHAAVWTGDAPSQWPTLAETLPMLLGLGLSGVAFVGSDVGGYSGGASPELFARWMQLGSLSPFFRGHVQTSAPPQEPWQFGQEVEDISRQAIAARYELLPTWYSLVDESARSGAPLLRPLIYEHQDDLATHAIDDQALLGPWLMFAPVLAEGATSRSVYLPAGRWFEARSGAMYEGPATIEVGVTLGALPLFVREGAIVAKGPPLEWSDQAPLSPLLLELYPGAAPSAFTLYEDEGDGFGHEDGVFRRLRYELVPRSDGASLVAAAAEGRYTPPARTLLVRVRRVDHGADAVRLDGDPLAEQPSQQALVAAGSGWFYDAADLSLWVALPDADGFALDLDYDPAIDDPRPPVPMHFVVDVPAGTPTTTPIHLATSSSGWQHQPLAWGPGPAQAEGTVLVPRGEYVFYKYTRGDWPTVEKWPGCVEADNRYELGAAHPDKHDTVFAWADLCP